MGERARGRRRGVGGRERNRRLVVCILGQGTSTLEGEWHSMAWSVALARGACFLLRMHYRRERVDGVDGIDNMVGWLV